MSRTHTVAAALTVTVVALPIYLLRMNDIAGLMVDDAWYLLLAKSLADGTGFKLINSPVEPILPLYPVGFPAVLSVVFRVINDFPANVWLLKSVSIAAMIGVGALTYVYLRTRELSRETAVSAAVAATLTPSFVFLATSTVMSECVFAVTQLAAIVLIHRSAESAGERRGLWLIALAALLTGAAVLMRSAAVAVAGAAMLWLLKERRWQRAALFAGVVAVCVVPWQIYTSVNAPTREQRKEHGGHIAHSYGEQFWMRWAGAPVSGYITVRDLPARIAENLTDVFTRGPVGVFVPALLRGPSESGEEVLSLGPGSNMGTTPPPIAISLTLSAIGLAGFIAAARRRVTVTEFLIPVTIAIVMVWPFWSFRFVLPLAPFLYFYLVTGVQVLTRSLRVAPLMLLCLIGLTLFDHAGFIIDARTRSDSGRMEWHDRAREADAALAWIRDHLPDDGLIASSNPALLYLRTGRKSLAYDDPTLHLGAWKARGFRYLISLRPAEMPLDGRRVLYQTPARLWVIEL